MSDQELERKVKEYSELKKENPDIDMNTLMLSALEAEHRKFENKKFYKWPFIISVSLTPIGAIYAIKYFLSGEEKDRNAGYICLALTAASILFVVFLSYIFTSSSGVDVRQIQQITPADIHELTN